MTTKNYLTLAFLSLIAFFGLTPIGGYGGHGVKFLAATIAYFILTNYGLKKTSTFKERLFVLLILALPPFLLLTPIHLNDFAGTRISFLSTLAHFIGIGVGVIAHFATMKTKIALSTILVAGSTWVAFAGNSLWLHKINYGTFTGKVDYNLPAPILGLNQHGETLTEESIKNKIVLLDFWHTKCGACFQKFPRLQEIYDNYKTDSSVLILAVNKPLTQDTLDQAFATLQKRGYSFPILIPSIESLPDMFDVQVYPTTFLIDKKGNVVFRGDIEKAGAALATMREKGM